jgi:hypothetical protein
MASASRRPLLQETLMVSCWTTLPLRAAVAIGLSSAASALCAQPTRDALQGAARIRVVDTASRREEVRGALVRWIGDTVVVVRVRDAESPFRVRRWHRVDVSVGRRTHVIRNGLLGAAAGTLAGAALGYASGSSSSSGWFTSNTMAGVGAGYGAVLGALVGGLTGRVRRDEWQVMPRPDRTASEAQASVPACHAGPQQGVSSTACSPRAARPGVISSGILASLPGGAGPD